MGSEAALQASRPVNIRRLGWHYMGIQGIFWANIACTAAYAVVILQSRGITNTEIGVIMACRALASIVMQPLVASLADRLCHRIPLKYFCLILVAVAFAANLGLLYSGRSYGLAILVFMVLGGSENVLAPINDALAIQYINGGYPLNYSVARGTGSVVFALTCLPLAWIVARFGTNAVIFLHAALLLLEFLILLTFRNYQGPVSGECERVRPPASRQKTYRQILSGNPQLVAFLAAALFLYMGNSAMYQFLPNILVNVGGSSADVGITLFVLAISQFPVSLFFSRLSRHFQIRTLLLASYAFVLVRMFLLQMAGSVPFVVGLMALELFGGGLQIQSEVFYINKVVDPADVVKGQSLTRIIPGGIGIMLGSLLAGNMLDLAGISGMLWVSIGLMLTGFVIMLAFQLFYKAKTPPPAAPLTLL